MSAVAVLEALADGNRRLILERLAHGPQPVGVLAEPLPISRPAVSQHLRVLKDAQLVSVSVAGTRHLYRIDPAGLAAVREYLDRFWATTLDNFAILAEREALADQEAERERAAESPAPAARPATPAAPPASPSPPAGWFEPSSGPTTDPRAPRTEPQEPTE